LFIPDPGSWIPILTFSHARSWIQGSKRHPIPDPGSGSATQIYFLVSDMVKKILSVQFYNILSIQGGSDKSGILKIFFENHTAQLKIIRF
jgi:hypothetical protein